jgi:hypothetical protein
MQQDDVESTLETLAALTEFELALADLYTVCDALFREDAALWHGLQRAEKRHAGYVKRIAELVAQTPAAFACGRPVTAAATRAQCDYVRHQTSELARGVVAPRTALLVAAELERSILESRFYELVVSDDPEFCRLTDTIIDETKEHSEAVAEQLRRRPEGDPV